MEGERVTIQDAARILGVSEGAVRKRVKRGTLRHDKTGDGRIWVRLEGASSTGVDAGVDEVTHPHTEALISELRAELAAWREESRRKDHIIAALAERIPPQLEAPAETPGEPDSAGGESSRGSAPPEAERGGERRRSWWREFLGI